MTTPPNAIDEETSLGSLTLVSGRTIALSLQRHFGTRYLRIVERNAKGSGVNIKVPSNMLGFLRDALARIDASGLLLPEDDTSSAKVVVRRTPSAGKRATP